MIVTNTIEIKLLEEDIRDAIAYWLCNLKYYNNVESDNVQFGTKFDVEATVTIKTNTP